MRSKPLQAIFFAAVLATTFSPGCSSEKTRQALTDSERLSQLLKYFKSNGFALEKSPPPESVDCIIEKSNDGGMAVTGFVIFPQNSDDAANEAALLDCNPASAYNARCKIAMFVPGIWGPPNTRMSCRMIRNNFDAAELGSIFEKF